MTARVLGKSDTVAEVFRLIDDAERELVLVSAYFDLTAHQEGFRKLQRAAKRGLRRTELIVRSRSSGHRISVEAVEQLRGLVDDGLSVFEVDYLHAKVYASDKHVITTSLNLLHTSLSNTIEVGIKFTRDSTEAKALLSVMQVELFDGKRPFDFREGMRAPKPAQSRKAERSPKKGFCVRCASRILFNPEKPYCAEDFEEWAEYENHAYEDEFCHQCGDEYPASMARPLCVDCYQKNGAPLDADD